MNIYLIQCSSIRILNEELAKIIKNSNNVTYLDLLNVELTNILEEASYFSLFEEIKYLVVKNANIFSSDKLKDKETELLLDYMKNPNSNTVLIFTTTDKIDLRKKITKELKEKQQVIIVEPLKPYEIIKRIEEYFKKQKYKYPKEIPSFISSWCLNNYDLVFNELIKIDLYYSDEKELKMEDIEKIVSHFKDDNNFKLVDAIITKNINKSIKILEDLKLMKTEPTVLVALLAREYRIMYHSKILLKKGNNAQIISKELGLQEWQIDKALKNAYDYTIEELENNLLSLSKIDKEIKSGVTSKYLPLELFIIDI